MTNKQRLRAEIMEGLVDEVQINVPGLASQGGLLVSAESESKAKYRANRTLLRQKYHYEKWTGRRRPDGALKLNSLSPAHLRMISAYINGMRIKDIAEQFKVAAITVGRVLADPLSQVYVEEFGEAQKGEFKAMFPLVAKAIRDALSSGNAEVKLKAVDRFAKISAMLSGPNPNDSRESRTEARTEARHKFIAMIKDAVPGGADIQIESEEVIQTVEVTTVSSGD